MDYTFDLKNPLAPRAIRVGDVVGLKEVPGEDESVVAWEIIGESDPRRSGGAFPFFEARRLSDGRVEEWETAVARFYPARAVN